MVRVAAGAAAELAVAEVRELGALARDGRAGPAPARAAPREERTRAGRDGLLFGICRTDLSLVLGADICFILCLWIRNACTVFVQMKYKWLIETGTLRSGGRALCGALYVYPVTERRRGATAAP